MLAPNQRTMKYSILLVQLRWPTIRLRWRPSGSPLSIETIESFAESCNYLVDSAQGFIHSALCLVDSAQGFIHSALCLVDSAQGFIHSALCLVDSAQGFIHSALCLVDSIQAQRQRLNLFAVGLISTFYPRNIKIKGELPSLCTFLKKPGDHYYLSDSL